MLTSQTVARDLPRLRRYARALTGSQASGDAYVTATLEALAEDPSGLTGEDGLTIGLYRAFTKIWNSVNGKTNRKTEVSTASDEHIVNIAPSPGRPSCSSRWRTSRSKTPPQYWASILPR